MNVRLGSRVWRNRILKVNLMGTLTGLDWFKAWGLYSELKMQNIHRNSFFILKLLFFETEEDPH